MENDIATVTRWGKVPAWWLLHEGMDADRFCVMAALATYADEEGFCMPSQATLARHLKRSRPWVNRVVAELAGVGLLEKTSRQHRSGGTRSCLYRLASAPGGVEAATPGVTAADSPGQGGDRNQTQPKQIQDARPPRAGDAPGEFIDPGWRPSPGDEAEALTHCPDADLAAHTALFVARSQAKGYRYRPGTEGRAWLSWLLADRAKAVGGRAREAAPGRRRPAAPTGESRLAAWGLAAKGVSPWEQ